MNPKRLKCLLLTGCKPAATGRVTDILIEYRCPDCGTIYITKDNEAGYVRGDAETDLWFEQYPIFMHFMSAIQGPKCEVKITLPVGLMEDFERIHKLANKESFVSADLGVFIGSMAIHSLRQMMIKGK